MRKYNVGVIGCGWADEKRARAYLMLSTVKIKSIADINECWEKLEN